MTEQSWTFVDGTRTETGDGGESHRPRRTGEFLRLGQSKNWQNNGKILKKVRRTEQRSHYDRRFTLKLVLRVFLSRSFFLGRSDCAPRSRSVTRPVALRFALLPNTVEQSVLKHPPCHEIPRSRKSKEVFFFPFFYHVLRKELRENEDRSSHLAVSFFVLFLFLFLNKARAPHFAILLGRSLRSVQNKYQAENKIHFVWFPRASSLPNCLVMSQSFHEMQESIGIPKTLTRRLWKYD